MHSRGFAFSTALVNYVLFRFLINKEPSLKMLLRPLINMILLTEIGHCCDGP